MEEYLKSKVIEGSQFHLDVTNEIEPWGNRVIVFQLVCYLTINHNIMKDAIIRIILGIFMFFLFYQCRQKSYHADSVDVDGNKLIVCNISSIVDSIDVPLSTLIDNCEYIPLETTDSSLFERVYHVGVSDNYIAVHSYGRHPVKLFNRQGKFIRNIGSIGRGPGEFTSLNGIQIDEPNNRLYLTPFAGAEFIIAYDLDGLFQGNIPLIYRQTKCKVYVDGDIITVLSMPFDDQIPVAYQQTINGTLIQKLPKIDHLILTPDFSSEVSSSRNSGFFDIQIVPWGMANYDTLYHYDTSGNKLIPKFVAIFSDKKQGSYTYDMKNHYWTWLLGDKSANKRVITDKKTLEANYFRLINDFYCGVEITNFFTSNNSMFIGSLSAVDILEEINEIKLNQKLNADERERLFQIENTVNENSNEILFIGKMK